MSHDKGKEVVRPIPELVEEEEDDDAPAISPQHEDGEENDSYQARLARFIAESAGLRIAPSPEGGDPDAPSSSGSTNVGTAEEEEGEANSTASAAPAGPAYIPVQVATGALAAYPIGWMNQDIMDRNSHVAAANRYAHRAPFLARIRQSLADDDADPDPRPVRPRGPYINPDPYFDPRQDEQ
jgi:hypothetical protein